MCCVVLRRDVTIVAQGTPSDQALEIIKSKKEDNVVVCDEEGHFVSGDYSCLIVC
jgi:hypothetical protein